MRRGVEKVHCNSNKNTLDLNKKQIHMHAYRVTLRKHDILKLMLHYGLQK